MSASRPRPLNRDFQAVCTRKVIKNLRNYIYQIKKSKKIIIVFHPNIVCIYFMPEASYVYIVGYNTLNRTKNHYGLCQLQISMINHAYLE